MSTAAPPTARCPVCGVGWPLAPDETLIRHPRQQHPAFAKNCKGSRKTPDKEKQP